MNAQVEKRLNIISIESSFPNIVSFVPTNILIIEKQSFFFQPLLHVAVISFTFMVNMINMLKIQQ